MTNANDLHETKTHGQLSFPYAVYKSDIPRDMRSFPLHWHDDAEIIYIESGSGVITVQSHEQNVGRGDNRAAAIRPRDRERARYAVF